MTYFNAHTQLGELKNALHNAPDKALVICYCAQWCRTCQQYQDSFIELAAQWPDYDFIWIDIEELPELLGDEDIEDFPSIQVQYGQKVVFFGTMLPHSEHLDRLLRDFHHQAEHASAKPSPGDLRALVATTA